jgi:hypothetical protein
VEKLGVIGVLLVVVGWLVWDRLRLLKELTRTYAQRDRWRLACVKYKAACDAAEPPIHVDISDLSDLVEVQA